MNAGDASYITKDGDMLDQICAAYYGATDGYVERVLAANPGLADRGEVYPAGISITLPAIPPPTPTLVRLYD